MLTHCGGRPPPLKNGNYSLQPGKGVGIFFRIFRTVLIVHDVKSRPGGPTAQLLLVCRAVRLSLKVNVKAG